MLWPIQERKTMRSQDDLTHLIRNGACLNINAGSRTQQDLVQLAALAKTNNAKIIMRRVGNKRQDDLVQIVANAPGNITFVFDD